MSDLNYFQRYSQRENHITNNVLLMLRHLERVKPSKLQTVISTIFPDAHAVEVGPRFEQQKSLSDSVPDGFIQQQGWRIAVEVKPGENWSPLQLERHQMSLNNTVNTQSESYRNTILLLLSTNPDADVGMHGQNTVSVSFDQLVSAIGQEEVIAPHETQLREIFEDFRSILAANDLLPDPYLMFAFGCARTMDWNIANKAYYETADRPTKLHVLNGFYGDRCIQAIGNSSATVEFEVGNSTIQCVPDSVNGAFAQSDMEQWLEGIDLPSLNPGTYRIYRYEADNFFEVSYRKETPGGYQSGVWIHIEHQFDEGDHDTSLAHIAKVIDGQSFPKDRGFAD